MSYNDKKFLDVNGLKHLISILDDYPTNEVLGTVINAIESEIPTNVSQLQNDAGYLTTHQNISGKANSADLAAVATSGDYDDLINKPTIPAVPVQDVQVNGTSVVQDGVANVPVADGTNYGVVKVNANNGVALNSSGILVTNAASSTNIKSGNNNERPLTANKQHESVFYGLAKAAGSDMASSSNPVGTYTDTAKQKIQNMLGITDLISTEETTTAITAHALNTLFLMGGKLYKATAAIAIGDAVVEGTNCQVVKADEVFVKNTDYASKTSAGIVKVNRDNTAIEIKDDGRLATVGASEANIKNGAVDSRILTPYNASYAVFYGLSKSAGVDLKDETVTYGTYPETSKTAIRSLIGAAAASDVTVSDVQVNGTSVLSNGVANVPKATNNILGVISAQSANGVAVASSGALYISSASVDNIKAGTDDRKPITSSNQDASVFYGLAKAAGDTTQAESSNAVGTYTESAKASIRTMLGAASTNIVAVQDEQPTDTDTKVWLPGTQAAGVQIPTMEDLGDYVQKTDYATTDDYGLVKVGSGLYIGASTGKLAVAYANSSSIKNGTNATASAPVSLQHESAFYGLAKAAGDTTQSASDNAVGTYTDGAKTAIRSMLGAVGDVQIDGTSVVSNGAANIPIGSTSSLGVVKFNWSSGIKIQSETGVLTIDQALVNEVKVGTHSSKPIVPLHQHEATFYGLAKAAGDTTQSASSNAVGAYTAEAKSAIQSMLGIDLQSIASEVEIPLVETVSGTTPSISGQPNTRYICGEVSTLSITPPAAGSIDVIFDSGSTAAILTVPNTVRWPAWFDATALEADTTYEILITDGVYGSVMTWAQ